MSSLLKYGVNFNGRRIVHPGAYDRIDASAMTIISEGSPNIPVIIGTARSGESGKIHWFTDGTSVRKYLTEGELVTGAELLFSPTPEGGGGASVIGVIIANPTKPATASIGPLKFDSIVHGDVANRTQIKIESASGNDIPGTKRITLYKWDTDEQEVYNNLGAVATIKYNTKVESPVALRIERDLETNSKHLKVLIGETGAQVEDVNIDLNDDRFLTINEVIAYLNSLSGYEVALQDFRNSGLSSMELDVTEADIDIKNTTAILRSNVGDIINQINTFSEIATVSLSETPEAPLKDAPFVYLDGGYTGPAPVSWAKTFEPLKEVYSNILVILNSQEAIHAEALQHVNEMENRQQKQVLFTGGGTSEPPAIVKARAARLNSSRAVIGYPGIYHSTYRAGRTPLPAYFTGALIAGRVCGMEVSDPVTFEYFNLIGLERELVAGDPSINELITSGVAVLEKVQNGGIRLVQGITTYISENNTLYREISVRRTADYISEEVRSKLEVAFVGKKFLGTSTTSTIVSKTVDILDQAIKDGHIIGYRNIVVRYSNTVVYVDYEVAPATPINYILITSSFVPETATSTL